MHIIQTTSALTPEFGGPVRTVPALCRELALQGHDVSLVYLEFGQGSNVVNLPVHPNLHYIPLPVKISLGMRPIIIPSYYSAVLEIAEGKDNLIIHDNGIWLPYSGSLLRIAKRTGAKIITSVHGMLEPWAMEYGNIRKYLGWHLYQYRRLSRNDILHATSREEAENIQKLSLTLPITVIPNGTVLPDSLLLQKSPDNEEKTLLFLSRIHPKKGLLNLVKAIGEIKPAGWKIIIAGYDEGGHKKKIQESVFQAGLEEYFSFPGPVADQEKWQLYRSADLFILPSYSENFGMVVAEALASGTPVITTHGTPWRDLVDYNCGWWVEPSVPGLVESLRSAFSMDQRELQKMGENGRKLVGKKYSWPSIANDMSEVYSWMLGHQDKVPDTII